MAPNLDDVLDAFQKQVETRVAEVAQVQNTAFRKALYVSMLHGLSACAYPNETKSGQRFKAFVVDIIGWKDGERVSLQQAALYFQTDAAMSAEIGKFLAGWPWGQPQTIAVDPSLDQLTAHKDLWRLQHANLLWQFRNHLLHAFADSGGFDIGGRAERYYMGDASTHTWRLVMPEQFLRDLLGGLKGLTAYCRKNGQDPQAHLGTERRV